MTDLTEVVELTGLNCFFSGANDVVPRVFFGHGSDFGEMVEHLVVRTFAEHVS